MTKLLCVYCASSDRIDPKYAAAATELGHAMVQRGWGLVYGGGNVGLMAVIADAVLERGGVRPQRVARALLQRVAAAPGQRRGGEDGGRPKAHGSSVARRRSWSLGHGAADGGRCYGAPHVHAFDRPPPNAPTASSRRYPPPPPSPQTPAVLARRRPRH